MDEKKSYIKDDMLTDKGSNDVEGYGALPSKNQYLYQRQEMSAFLHFGMNTFTGNEWGDGTEPTSSFYLNERIDADTYVKVLKDAGFKRLMFTAKHHDGFCLWDSKYTDYDIASTNYPGDVLEDISAACSKYNIEMGLYLSPWDRNSPYYGYYDAAGNPTDEEHDVLDYNEYFVNQLTEILSNPKYGCNGHFVTLWLDGAKGSGADAQWYNYEKIISTMYKYEGIEAGYEDNPLVFETIHNTIRWIGNELGIANEENWSKGTGVIDSTTGLYKISDNGKIVEYNGTNCNMGVKNGNLWVVPEADARITSGWFWGENKSTPKAIEELRDMYLNSVGHNAVFLLNVPMNTSGKLDEDIQKRLLEFGKSIKSSFHDNNLLLHEDVVISASEVRNNDIKFKPSNVADEDSTTYWAAQDESKEASLHIDFGHNVTFDTVSIEEDIRFGQRIEKYVIYYKNTNGEWREFSTGTTIGGKRIAFENPVTTQELLLCFTGMTAEDKTGAPVISRIGVYCASKGFAVESTAPKGIEEYSVFDQTKFSAKNWEAVNALENNTKGYLRASKGKTMNITFEGTKAWLIGETDKEETVLFISIDGNKPEIVKIYANEEKHYKRQYETPTLLEGKHDITITVVSGVAKICGLYVLNNSKAGMIEFENDSYVVNEDMSFDVKIVRKGGTTGRLSAIVQDNPGSAVQSSYYPTEGIPIEFKDGEIEKYVTIRTKRYVEKTGTLSFYLQIVSNEEDGIITGFNNPVAINIFDAENYSGDYLKYIGVEKVPNKVVYNVGDELDILGLEIYGSYITGEKRMLLPDQYTLTPNRFTTAGVTTITVESIFDKKKTSFNVVVNEKN